MKTSSFYPIFASADPEAEASWYKQMFGFYIRHRLTAGSFRLLLLENDTGERLDLISWPVLGENWQGMRVNADNFDAAAALFAENGFVPAGDAIEAESFRAQPFTREGRSYLLMSHIL